MDKGIKITTNGFNCGAQMTCPACGCKDMDGHGGSFGGRITIYNRKCPDCGTTLMIVPMKENFNYSVSAKTDEEQDKDWKTRQEITNLEKQADLLRGSLR